ncbi:MAG: recombinase family protein, partial [Lacticaseibacillus paracasei]|nr:recombinase family protein [Lacticaseibacillus paracasei]
MRYGYARVSTKDQNLARQIAILNAYNVEKVFKEKESGAKLRRPILTKVLTLLKPGDELIVSSLDRLSRDADHLT